MLSNIILVLLSLSVSIYAQIPLNGFCRFREFSTKINSSKIFGVDINNDGWRDIVSLPADRKNYNIQFWSKEKFSNPVEKNINFFLYDLKLKNPQSKETKRFVFLSRKDRLFGLLSFSSSGNINIISKTKLNGFASNFDLSDIDNDGSSETLVSGTGFEGLSIFYDYKKTLLEKKILTGRIFSYASFIDLDYDSYTDIVAVDLFTNSFVFLYNNGVGDFKQNRVLKVSENIEQLKVADVNSDGFNDLIYVYNNKFVIYKGDSVSSFIKKEILNCPSKPDKYYIFDFNADGYNDIAFINKSEGSLYITFAKNTESFYEPVLYLKRNEIIDFDAYVDRGGRKLVVLDTSGKVYLIDKAFSLGDGLSITLQSKPTVLGIFNYMYETMQGLYFVDEESTTLNILLGRRDYYVEKYYRYPLSYNPQKIIVEETKKEQITFYCYSNSLIEILSVNFENNKLSRRILYAKGSILELKVSNNRLTNTQIIYIISKKNNKLFFESYEFRDFRYVNTDFVEISGNIESATLSFNLGKEIYYSSRFNNVLYLNKIQINNTVENPVNLTTLSLDDVKNYSTEVKSISSQNEKDKPIFVILGHTSYSELIVLHKGHLKTINFENYFIAKNYIRFYESNNYGNLFLYDNQRGKIKKVVFDKNYLNYRTGDIFDSKTINDYFIQQIKNKQELIVYTDSSDNLIKFNYVR
ncbi:FG-GAP repeat domain-containing protein [Rosettibacter firmus]|uniref:FG-GAP repeat domain-containing protein n=1 Tax=Rosettibacter firmus TaxID=3111522 RepID=UPI00336BD5C6